MKFRFLPLTLPSLLLILLSGCLGLTLGTRSETETLPTVTIPGANLPANLDVALGLSLSAPELDIGAESALVTFVSVRVLKLQILEASERDANEDGTPDSFDFVSKTTSDCHPTRKRPTSTLSITHSRVDDCRR